uniref:Uncharacterized protein n=1 Tax=Syphacia muris TaxID=451379 RepID=A0A0N5AJ12_9BILA
MWRRKKKHGHTACSWKSLIRKEKQLAAVEINNEDLTDIINPCYTGPRLVIRQKIAQFIDKGKKQLFSKVINPEKNSKSDLVSARDSCNCNCDCDERCRHIPVYIYEKRVPVPVAVRPAIAAPVPMPVATVTTTKALGGFGPMMGGGWVKK